MMIMTLLRMLDIVCLSTILVCSCEVLRQTIPRRDPWLTMAFLPMALGSLWWFKHIVVGDPMLWGPMILHAGFAIHCVRLMFVLVHEPGVLQRAALASPCEPW